MTSASLALHSTEGKGTKSRRMKCSPRRLIQNILVSQLLLIGPAQGRSVAQSHGLHGGIAWSACPDATTLDCAYITAPMNHLNPQPNLTVSIALRRLPATVGPRERLGTLFINPGGPGGSGTLTVTLMGQLLSQVVQGKYDILGFDPRGVNLTSPGLDCYADEAYARLHDYNAKYLGFSYEARLFPGASPYLHDSSYALTEEEQAAADSSELAWITKHMAHRQAQVEVCMEHGNENMLKSTSTSFVARDMKWILEALGEEDGGLNYWGFSYGTILGATFAAMFPESVGRVVLDGVADSVTYTRNNLDWGISGMDDNEDTYYSFLSSCIEAGASRCALVKDNSTESSIHERIAAVSASLLESPLPVASMDGVDILTASQLHKAIFLSLYNPDSWQRLAQGLSEAEDGEGYMIWRMNQPGSKDTFVHKKWDENILRRPMNVEAAVQSRHIMCADTNPKIFKNFKPKDLQVYLRRLNKLSTFVGEYWALWVTSCAGWDFEPFEAYRGPWTVEEGTRKTSFPILFIGNTYDPVTPLSAAKSMSKGFGNDSASLLIQNGYGHCSVAQPSICTARAVRNYFVNSTVPEYGTVCEVDPGFLFPEAKREDQADSLSFGSGKKLQGDLELLESINGIGKELARLRLTHI
ncbi:hypothetical protein BT69DRAFT_1272046 [Atractiella rhizophila]|nr:hypothetical protein BT69DRAFT_1272046 [Atractiella rhizophila]